MTQCEEDTVVLATETKTSNASSSSSSLVDITHFGTSQQLVQEVEEEEEEEEEDPNATDHSSSFGDTISATHTYSTLSETEVDSEFSAPFDALAGFFHLRKKRLTSHWRSFIRPLLWRCKWAELRLKEIELQASKYSTELAAYDQAKHSGLDQLSIENFCSKSLPCSSQNNGKMAMRRRKRKRLEVTTDISSYMLNHNLFSYLETKRFDRDGSSVLDESGNKVMADQNVNSADDLTDDQSFFELADGDSLSEQFLWKIEMMQSRVHKLKCQLDLVISMNSLRFSSSENLSPLAACDAETSSVDSPTISVCKGETVPVSAIFPLDHISEYGVGDMTMFESAVSSYGEAIPVPDIIESTVLLSAADVTPHQPQVGIGDLCEQVSDSGPVQQNVAPEDEQSAQISCLASDFHFATNRRKRGERKAGLGSWNKKSSGEPES